MTNSPCPDIIPSYYPLTLHIIAVISAPINLIGFYLVVFQSPKMQGYKYCLCYLQFVSFLTEIHISWTFPGYYFLPMLGGLNIGFNVISPHLSMTLFIFIFAFELPSMLICFVFRHNSAEEIHKTTHRTLYIKKFFLLLTHIYPFAAAIAMWNSNLTQEQRHVFMKENWPQCVHWLSVPSFEIYDYHLNPMLSVVGIGAISLVFIVFSYCTILGIHTMSILQKYRKSMSRQTYQMHKNALFSLAMQIMIPAILVVIPLGFCLIVVVTGAIGLQELATDTLFLVGSHSMCSSSVMILCNQRYRKVMKEKLEKVFGLIKLTNPKTTVEPSQLVTSLVVSNKS